MYELIQAAGSSYYIESPAKIGLVKLGGNEVCLIDSGSDKDAGRRVRQILDANGWKLRAIYNTHSNADHIGGNSYLQKQTGCRIYAPGIECCFTRYPQLEPSLLFGGYPMKDLRHKFLMAQESDVQSLTEASLPEGFALLPLPGRGSPPESSPRGWAAAAVQTTTRPKRPAPMPLFRPSEHPTTAPQGNTSGPSYAGTGINVSVLRPKQTFKRCWKTD